jgi:hypothetical protein
MTHVVYYQVFYLDNLGFGSLSPVHDVFPRIKAYPSERMCALVAADTKKDYMSSLDMFGVTKVICCNGLVAKQHHCSRWW